ncbi:MAG: hypothetical protein U5Q44_02990 [Dehalococcoidia bacterium]|nr:hypothetical protein [Dehalococcoidia bacterium]
MTLALHGKSRQRQLSLLGLALVVVLLAIAAATVFSGLRTASQPSTWN